MTPIEELEEAVKKYLTDTDITDTLSGFVLTWQVERINNDLGLAFTGHSVDTTMSLSTSPALALGLAHTTVAKITDALAGRDY